MILRFVLTLLMIELVVLYTQSQLFVQHNVFAKDIGESTSQSFYYQRELVKDNYLSFDSSDYPVFLSIPRIGINSRVDEGYIKNDGIWKVYLEKLSYPKGLGEISNNFSNIVIYGHATDLLLGNLHEAKKNDKVVIFGYHKVYEYKVQRKEEILPDEPDRLLTVGDTNLTIFTCDGELDEKRLVVKAKLIKSYNLPWEGGVNSFIN